MNVVPDASGEPLRRVVEITAPAKVNLGLRIVGEREDGYHLLDSLFSPLELSDALRIEVLKSGGQDGPRVELALSGGEAGRLPADERNLAVRAALRFLARAGLPERLGIALQKCIPSAAGLGGGSSDAAAVLRALSQLYPGALAAMELEALALELGADVPFFLEPQPCRVQGVGEQRTPVAGLPPLWLLLVKPAAELSTARVYAGYDEEADALTPSGLDSTMRPPAAAPAGTDSRSALDRGSSNGPVGPAGSASGAASGLAAQLEALLIAPAARSSAADDALFLNDLEPAATRLCPEIATLREKLRRLGALATGMSGSGPTVFGLFEDESRAQQALADGVFRAAPKGREASAGTGHWARVALCPGSRYSEGVDGVSA